VLVPYLDSGREIKSKSRIIQATKVFLPMLSAWSGDNKRARQTVVYCDGKTIGEFLGTGDNMTHYLNPSLM